MTIALIIIISVIEATIFGTFILSLFLDKATLLHKNKSDFSNYSAEPIYIYEHRMIGIMDLFQ